jgi:hypothetical protein
MVSNKKIEFLVKQGFERDIVKMFIDCGVEKHLIWFLSMHKKGCIEYLNGEDVKMVNSYLEKTSIVKSKKITYYEAHVAARAFNQNEKRKERNKIYNFKNGYYVSILNGCDLAEEGEIMANCVGSYFHRVSGGNIAILALKNPSQKTVVHLEINNNGLMRQNFSKANTQLNKEYWMMILEFFNNNSKSVDLSRAFGESYVTSGRGGFIEDVILSVPTKVNLFLENGDKKSEQIDGFEIKRFTPFSNTKQSIYKKGTQSEVINWIEQRKLETIQSYDDLIMQISSTSASNLYLSDAMKDKIFGTKKDSYLMKGENYNISEIDPRIGHLEEPGMDLMDEVMDVDADNIEEVAPAPAEMENNLINGLEIEEAEARRERYRPIGGLAPMEAGQEARRHRPIIIDAAQHIQRVPAPNENNLAFHGNGRNGNVVGAHAEERRHPIEEEIRAINETLENLADLNEKANESMEEYETRKEIEYQMRDDNNDEMAKMTTKEHEEAHTDERPRLDVQEIPFNGRYECPAQENEHLAEGEIEIEVFEMAELRVEEDEQIEGAEEIMLEPGDEPMDIVRPPEHFNDIIRRAVRE